MAGVIVLRAPHEHVLRNGYYPPPSASLSAITQCRTEVFHDLLIFLDMLKDIERAEAVVLFTGCHVHRVKLDEVRVRDPHAGIGQPLLEELRARDPAPGKCLAHSFQDEARAASNLKVAFHIREILFQIMDDEPVSVREPEGFLLRLEQVPERVSVEPAFLFHKTCLPTRKKE